MTRRIVSADIGGTHARFALATISGDKVVEVSRSVFRSDRFTLWVQIGQDF